MGYGDKAIEKMQSQEADLPEHLALSLLLALLDI